MQRRNYFCIALFCLICALIGISAVAGLFPTGTAHRSTAAVPRESEGIHHVLTGAGTVAAGARDASIDFSWPGRAQWIEAPVRRSCRPMGHSYSTQSTRSLPACLTV